MGALLGENPTLIFLTVPDQALPEVTDQLARSLAALGRPVPREPSPSGQQQRATVVHTSGATSVEVLTPLAELGYPTLALHPLQTFAEPVTGAAKLTGSAFAITPGPLSSYDEGARLALSLGGRPFRLEEENRPLYHAAAVFASNYLVTLASLAEELAQAAGLKAEIALESLLPLMQGSLDNLAAQGSTNALTGPLSRGDEATVALHLASLSSKYPDALPAYLALGRATLRLVSRRGEVSPEALERLSALLESGQRTVGRQQTSLDAPPPGGAQPENP
jgi:predicted short-subunit dehydrogenase-like oxidoreductase (DUF2520 family)